MRYFYIISLLIFIIFFPSCSECEGIECGKQNTQIVQDSPNNEWDILIEKDQDKVNHKIINNMKKYLNLEENDIDVFMNKIEYYTVFLQSDNKPDNSKIKFSSEKELLEYIYNDVVVEVYNSIFRDIIEKHGYNVKEMNKHVFYDHENTSISGVRYEFYVSYNNHLFIEKNYFIVQVDAKTLKVNMLKSNILSLKKQSSIGEDVESKLEEYKKNDKENSDKYFSFYADVERGPFIPIILRWEEGKNVPTILYIYKSPRSMLP